MQEYTRLKFIHIYVYYSVYLKTVAVINIFEQDKNYVGGLYST